MKTEALDPSPDGCHDAALPNCSPDNPPTPSSSVLQLIAATIIIFHKVIIVAQSVLQYDVLTFAAAVMDLKSIERLSSCDQRQVAAKVRLIAKRNETTAIN